MKIATFLHHWSIQENPFKAEEARQDDVFDRLHGSTVHPDFEKILGDLARPSSSVVFGEKGSGKTAIRLQIEEAIAQFNRDHPQEQAFMVAYDDLNPILDRFSRRVGGKDTDATLSRLRLVDHIDGILATGVTNLVNRIVEPSPEGGRTAGLTGATRTTLKRQSPTVKQDWVLLQTLYDRAEQNAERGRSLRRALRYHRKAWTRSLRWVFFVLVLIVAITGGIYGFTSDTSQTIWGLLIGLIAVSILGAISGIHVAMRSFHIRRLAKQLSAQLRILDRPAESFRISLERVPWDLLSSVALPVDELDDPRYEMLERLKRSIRALGYTSIIVLIDRVDEPTLVSGHVDRMRAIVWPLFNNKFMQQDHFAVKMMLPLDLRHELFRQSGEFFQEARLDKQNMVDRLTWSGAHLYDLCSSRLNACLAGDAEPLSLTQLFEDSVSRQDLVDALDQMKQPRDAFKMMYHLIQDHCSNTTEEEEAYHIPKLVLDQARRSQTERLEELQRGLRPA